KQVLLDGDAGSRLSKRARTRLGELRTKFDFLSERGTALVQTPGGATWWTFAGGAANAVISAAISPASSFSAPPTFDDLSLPIVANQRIEREPLRDVAADARLGKDVYDEVSSEIKFSSCVPQTLLEHCLDARLLDREAAKATLNNPIVVHRTQD